MLAAALFVTTVVIFIKYFWVASCCARFPFSTARFHPWLDRSFPSVELLKYLYIYVERERERVICKYNPRMNLRGEISEKEKKKGLYKRACPTYLGFRVTDD